MVSLVPAQTSLKNIIRAYVQLECSDASEASPSPTQLETLEVLAEDYRESDFENFFKRVKLPQIRKLLVDTHTHYVMKCCANVESLVVIHRQRFGPTYLKSIPFVAGSLVHLALCLPVPENIEGAGVPYYRR